MKIAISLLALAALVPSLSHGSAGMFNQFVFTSTNAGALAFYDTAATTGNPDFNGAFLGTLSRFSDTLQIGGQQRIYKDNGTDVTNNDLFYRIYKSGDTPGAFASVNMDYQFNTGVNNDQQWGGDVQAANTVLDISSNVLSGLPSNGTYILEVYSRITTNQVNEAQYQFTNNSGNNFKATITVVPEPSRALLVGFGLAGLMFRRRR